MPRPRITCIVPVFNRRDLALAMLRSLPVSVEDAVDGEFIVVDDGSDAETAAGLRLLGAPFKVEHNSANLGFGAAVNRAARAAAAPTLAILNGDLVLEPGWLEPMLAVLETHPEAFAVGNLHFADDDGRLDHAGTIFHAGGHPIHFRDDLDFVRSRPVREFPAVSAACWMVRRERFLELGGFDERYRNGFEDVDLCLRARCRGWPSFVANDSRVGHHISASPGRKAREEENRRLFMQRWASLTQTWERDWDERLAMERAALRRGAGGRQPAAPGRRSDKPAETPDRDFAIRDGDSSHLALRTPSSAVQSAPPPLRVVVDLARLAPGGANGGIKVFARHLLRAAAEVAAGRLQFHLVLAANMRREADLFTQDGHEVWLLPPAAAGPCPRGVHQLTASDAGLARSLLADVLYCPLGVSDFHSPDLPSIALVVDTLHRDVPGSLPWDEVPRREAWFDRLVHTSFRIQCNSNWVAGRVQHHWGMPAGRLFVVYNAVHDAVPWSDAGESERPEQFLFPANAWPHKNHRTLLVAYRNYRRRAGKGAWRLVLTGHRDAAMDRLAAHAAALGLGGAVEFAGHLDAAAYSALWRRTGALVFPSLHEGFGIPVLEAMARGIPVVAGRVAAIPEVAGNACLYVDPRDPVALAQAMERVQQDAPLRTSLTEAGRARAAQFVLGREARKLVAAIEEAAATFRANGITWRWDNGR